MLCDNYASIQASPGTACILNTSARPRGHDRLARTLAKWTCLNKVLSYSANHLSAVRLLTPRFAGVRVALVEDDSPTARGRLRPDIFTVQLDL